MRGNDGDKSQINLRMPTAADAHQANVSEDGVRDLVGNFAEWCSDEYVLTGVPAGKRPQLMADLRANAQTLAFIKSDRSLSQFLRDLPGTLEFVPQGRQGQVTAGWVLPRWLASPNVLVER